MTKICQSSPRGGRTRNLFLCVPACTLAHTGWGGDTEGQLQGHPSGSVPAPSPTPSRVTDWTWTSLSRLHRLGYHAPGICWSPAGGLQAGTTQLFHMGSENPTRWLCFASASTFRLSDPSLQESAFSLHLLIPRASYVHPARRLHRSGGGRSTGENGSHFVAIEAYTLLHLSPQFPRVSVTSMRSSSFRTIMTTGQGYTAGSSRQIGHFTQESSWKRNTSVLSLWT